MLVLNDAGVRGFGIGVVDDSVALIVGAGQRFGFKANAAVLQGAQGVIKISVNGAGVDHLVSQRIQLGLVLLIVRIQAHLDAVQQVGNHLGVAADWDSLIQGIEIVVVKGQAHGQALDDEGGQIFAVAAPLLLGVALDELLIDVTAHERDCLFF